MADRDEYVEKIENELRKPVAERNQSLLDFWNNRLSKLEFQRHNFVTPAPSRSNGAAVNSFKRRLSIRNDAYEEVKDRCELCGNGYDGLQHGHLYDKALCDSFNKWYKEGGIQSYCRDIPDSVHATVNGLMLCPNCHRYLVTKEKKKRAIKGKPDERANRVKIDQDGTIVVAETTQKKDSKMAALHNTKVPWASLIGHREWPTTELLRLVYDMKAGLPLPTSSVLSDSSSGAAPQVARATPLSERKSILKRSLSETSETSQTSVRRTVVFDSSTSEDTRRSSSNRRRKLSIMGRSHVCLI